MVYWLTMCWVVIYWLTSLLATDLLANSLPANNLLAMDYWPSLLTDKLPPIYWLSLPANGLPADGSTG
jgi:hypothetical protein